MRTEKHEVYDDKEAPDDGTSYDENDSENRSRNFLEHDEEKYRYTKTDKFTDYYKVIFCYNSIFIAIIVSYLNASLSFRNIHRFLFL